MNCLENDEYELNHMNYLIIIQNRYSNSAFDRYPTLGGVELYIIGDLR
jgi:hypothetical protein